MSQIPFDPIINSTPESRAAAGYIDAAPPRQRHGSEGPFDPPLTWLEFNGRSGHVTTGIHAGRPWPYDKPRTTYLWGEPNPGPGEVIPGFTEPA